MTKQYKRKFLVEGETIQTCDIICPDKVDRPCYYYIQKTDFYGRPYDELKQDINRCPVKWKLDKLNHYIVSETIDGKWECSCKGWIFKWRRLGKDCHHIELAKAHPEKYEIDKEMTEKGADIIRKALAG